MTSQLTGSLKMIQGNTGVKYYARCKNSPSGLIELAGTAGMRV